MSQNANVLVQLEDQGVRTWKYNVNSRTSGGAVSDEFYLVETYGEDLYPRLDSRSSVMGRKKWLLTSMVMEGTSSLALY